MAMRQAGSVFRREQVFGATHQLPVVLVSDSAVRADLIVAAFVIDTRPGKAMGTTSAENYLQEIHGLTPRLRNFQSFSQ
jgi:hypothetical protein